MAVHLLGGSDVTPAEAIDEVRRMRDVVKSAPLGDAMRKCMGVMHESVRGNFERAAAPDGAQWPPRKIEGDGHPLLNDTGFLLAAATGQGPGAVHDVGQREVVIGVDKSVQLGGIPGAMAHDRGDQSRNLPQRHYMAPTETALDECGEVIGDAVMSRLEASPR